MKKNTILVLTLVCSLGFCTSPIFATEENIVQTDDSSEYFYDLNENDKVLELSDGGFLYGSATITDNEDSSITETYDSLTDENSITVKEARIILKKQSNQNLARGANVPDVASKTITLDSNAEYKSSEFSGSGWRFGGYFFKAKSGTGTYLRWTSYKDGGRIGNYSEAIGTKNGTIQGTAIEKNQTQYVSRGGSAMIYYTYSPTNGTYYYVVNK